MSTRPFTHVADDIYQDLRQTSLVLMPSKIEGFGLAGLEAIAAGVPVVVSSESGLAELLFIAAKNSDLDGSLVEACVADVVGATEDAPVELWGRRIRDVMLDRTAAFERAGALRSALRPILNWRRAAEEFTAAVLAAIDEDVAP